MATPANGYQFTVLGNAVDGGSVETKFKWGLTVHATHYGSVKDNVVYNYNGASIATEDGSESFNVFDHNFALRGIGEPSNSVSEARMAMGTEGVGFWFRGPNNFVKNNVAANFQNPTVEAAYGYAFLFRYLGNIAVPKFKGAMNAADFTTVSGHAIPIRQFEDNEAYGAMQGGFTQWWVGGQDPNPTAGVAESVIKNLVVWHVYNKAVYMYPSHRVVVRRPGHPRQVRLDVALLRRRRVLRGLLLDRHCHPQQRHSGHGGRDQEPVERVRRRQLRAGQSDRSKTRCCATT